MTVFSVGGRLHVWRECLPMRSHYAIKSVDVPSLDMQDVCKRCRVRLSHEGWPKR